MQALRNVQIMKSNLKEVDGAQKNEDKGTNENPKLKASKTENNSHT